MKLLPTPSELADEFCLVLHEWLDDETIAEVNRRNTQTQPREICATHDFCDPNQAMLEALSALGVEFDDSRQAGLIDVVNQAWDIAVERQFELAGDRN